MKENTKIQNFENQNSKTKPKLYSTKQLAQTSLDLLLSAGYEITMRSPDAPLAQGDDLKQIIESHDVIVIKLYQKVTEDMLSVISPESKKVIVTLSAGIDHIAKPFFSNPNVTIINAPGANAVSVAEHIFAFILNLKKRISEGNTLVMEGQGHINNMSFLGNEISGKTLGLIGAGAITREVARMASAFGLKILCHTKDEHLFGYMLDFGATFVDLDTLLKQSDIVNILVPLLPATRHMINEKNIPLMKTDATFVNAARTDVVDTRALIAYADKHPNFKVGLDIDINEFAELLSTPRHNVIVTPHTAGLTVESKMHIENMVIKSILKA